MNKKKNPPKSLCCRPVSVVNQQTGHSNKVRDFHVDDNVERQVLCESITISTLLVRYG